MQEFTTLSIDVRHRVAYLTINHPPINLFDMALISEMNLAAQVLSEDECVNVVVVQSADPDFFIAHADVNLIQDVAGSDPKDDPEESFFHVMTEQFRLMSKPVIGKISGIARGGGLELLSALDMRFCSLENTTLAQPEITVGIIPGGGGSSRWPEIIGYSRAMELMLSGADFDGPTAERYGIVNRALPMAELDQFVEDLANRIAKFPPHAAALIKSVGQIEDTIEKRLNAEAAAFLESARHPTALDAMKEFMANGGQTREAEKAGVFD